MVNYTCCYGYYTRCYGFIGWWRSGSLTVWTSRSWCRTSGYNTGTLVTTGRSRTCPCRPRRTTSARTSTTPSRTTTSTSTPATSHSSSAAASKYHSESHKNVSKGSFIASKLLLCSDGGDSSALSGQTLLCSGIVFALESEVLGLVMRMLRKNPCRNLFVWIHISSQTMVSSVV